MTDQGSGIFQEARSFLEDGAGCMEMGIRCV